MRGLWKLTLMEAKLFLREPFAAFFTLAFPLMMLFIFGSIYGNEPTPFFNGRGSVDVSVPRYMAMIIASVGMLSIAITLSVYRERGVLRRYRATPLRPQTIALPFRGGLSQGSVPRDHPLTQQVPPSDPRSHPPGGTVVW